MPDAEHEVVTAPAGDPLVHAVLAQPLPPDRNPALVYLARLGGETSAVTMRRVLQRTGRTLARWCGTPELTWELVPWHALRYQHVAALRAQWLRAGLRPRTIRQYLAAVQGVVDEAENLRLLPPDEARMIRKVRAPRIADEDPAGRAVDDGELRAMMEACDPGTVRGRRDRALLALLFGGGLRRREVAQVRIEDINEARGEVRVRGKGSKVRTVPLALDALATVVACRRDHAEDATGPLLMVFDLRGTGERRPGAGLTESGVWSVLRAIAARARVARLTPHDARRTRITAMLVQGESIALVQRIAGHKSAETTGRYARTEPEQARAAAQRVPMLQLKSHPL